MVGHFPCIWTPKALGMVYSGGEMRNRIRRYVNLLLAVALLLGTAACGGKSSAELEELAKTGVAQTAAAYSPTPPPPPTSTPSPTSTKIPSPTVDRVAEARAISMTQTAEADICIRWDQVNESHFGPTKICVYGRIVKLQESERYAQIVRFSDEAGTFMLWSEWFTYLGLDRGKCVAAVGYLTREGNFIGMGIGFTEMYDYDGCD